MKRITLLVVGVAALAAGWWYVRGGGVTGPQPGSAEYERASSSFYRGLAALDVGLLDIASTSFVDVTNTAPAEPAGWSNLALTRLRGSQFDAAVEAAQRAVDLAPERSDLMALRAVIEIARGQLDAGIAGLRRAVMLDPRDARARFSLADALQSAGSADSDREALQQLDEVLTVVPGNLAVLVERARLAVRLQDAGRRDDSIRQLAARSGSWPPAAAEQFTALQSSVGAGDAAGAGRAIAFLRNVLVSDAAFRQSLAQVRVPAELMAEPIDRFVRLPVAPLTAAPPDFALRYTAEPLGDMASASVLAWPMDEAGAPALFAVTGDAVTRLDRAGSWPAPAGSAIVPLDWDQDFRVDLVLTGPSGVRLLLRDSAGGFSDRTAAVFGSRANAPATGAWAADVDLDGDLDLVVGSASAAPLVLRNNGDGTSQVVPLFIDAGPVRGFVWADLDADGDPDAAFLGSDGNVLIYANQQGSVFTTLDPLSLDAVGLAVADVNGDGTFDLVTCDRQGVLRRSSLRGEAWETSQIGTSRLTIADAARLVIADLDNSGTLDIVVASGGASEVWLADDSGVLTALNAPAADVFAAVDLTNDGRLDLVGIANGRPVRLVATGSQPYHWQVVRPRAQAAAGDQRINSFGVGGEIEVRAGLLVQKQVLSGAPVHVGLGTRTAIDVARIVWPNGVAQAEFDVMADRSIVAEQRLKGSCPWVFAGSAAGMTFVTDFLWRSPLGLRINAQQTAGITQTEDWVRIRGDQLAARNGAYDIRITAELWETHFFDHVSLMTVDHPVGSEIVVDERFSARPWRPEIHTVSIPVAVAGAWDDRGRDLTADVATLDGRHAAGFDRGRYQGIAGDHALELAIGEDAPADGALFLVAQGWVYPTDSSINVAISQGRQAAPRGIKLEAQDATGMWHTLDADAGFPSGKNKTMLLDLSARPRGARRFRLSTNLEIYWDRLAWATPVSGATPRTERLAAASAELRYRGFSRTTEDRERHAPETPQYEPTAAVGPRWRDLVGYHTRFGDVSELLAGVDDRYVIMNAGDEMRLSFPAPSAPKAGWVRDFVLIGDGWEKDGDFNTGYSKTVLPLPLHGRPDYVATSPELEQDPAFMKHPDDWQRFHTRFVAPDRYLRGLRPRQP